MTRGMSLSLGSFSEYHILSPPRLILIVASVDSTKTKLLPQSSAVRRSLISDGADGIPCRPASDLDRLTWDSVGSQ